MCSRTVKDEHEQSRHTYGYPRTLKGCSRTPHGRYADHHEWYYHPGSSRINTAVFNFQTLSCWPPGAPRTFPDVSGPTWIDTEIDGGYTVQMPEYPGYEPC
ncbi:hypothetical protein DPMN_144688 [Dreissena polymorpha]|uniref:Uncharacterized protein n=1 Tax=Dreissena polymorpha TaxID=45954 RepID=A0A9D4J0I5_DREPO|nr:hypothetical protein DPMN_144688 [Dreissena polymorpha]